MSPAAVRPGHLSCRAGLAVTLAAAAGLASAAAFAAGATTPASQRVVREGIAVDFTLEPLAAATTPAATEPAPLREGDDVLFRFTAADTAGGQPLTGLYPAAWMSRLRPGETVDPAGCVQKVEDFVGGSILNQAELDLNVYYVLALNDDASISVVDPLFGFGGTKLLAMIDLPAPGEDWALTPDRRTLLVSVPDRGQVAVADTLTWRVTDLVDVGGRPTAVALQPDAAYLWVVLDERESKDGAGAGVSGVAVVDVRTRRVAATIATGPGPHALAIDPDDRYAFVTNAGAGTVSVIDVARLTVVAEIAVGGRPTSVAYSPLAGAAYVSDPEGGRIAVIDGRSPAIRGWLPARPGVGKIRISPDGRLGFAVNPTADRVHIFDTALDRIVQTAETLAEPDQVAFTESLAYVLHRGSEIVLMIPLDQVGEKQGEAGAAVPAADFPGGMHPFGAGRRPSRAAAIVRAPGSTAVLVANPADQAIYFYKEGMAAPMGSFQNYDREPRAVLVVDRSLRERGRPGSYETAGKLREPGRYEVAFFLDSPRIVHCFEATVAPDPKREAERQAALPLAVEPLVAGPRVAAGEPVELRFRLTDPNSGRPALGLTDVVVMAFTTANWQRRQPATEVGDGIYAASIVLPSAGTYFAVVESPSGRLRFHLSPRITVDATAAAR